VPADYPAQAPHAQMLNPLGIHQFECSAEYSLPGQPLAAQGQPSIRSLHSALLRLLQRRLTAKVYSVYRPVARRLEPRSAGSFLTFSCLIDRVAGEAALNRPHQLSESRELFFFFSNRLGCLGSLTLSIAVTAVLILLLRQ
jgi:hypothetical protein